MDFREYQEGAARTALYKDKYGIGGISYCSLGLCGESGEIANKIKKVIRGDKRLDNDAIRAIADEIGDVLWYCAELAENLGWNLDEIARLNLDKLASRQQRGQVQGSGDNR